MVYTKARRDRASVVNGEGLALDLEDLEIHVVDLREHLLVHHLAHRAKPGHPAIDKGADVVRVKGRVVDLVQHEDDRLAQIIAEAADDLHHVRGVVDVQVVGRLVQQHVFRVLRDDHGDERPLPLPAGKLVDEAVAEGVQLHVLDGPLDDGHVLPGHMVARIGEAPEGHQLLHGQFHLDVVGLGENGQPLGQFLALPAGNVLPLEVHQAAVAGDEAGKYVQHRGLARPVRPDHGDDRALGDVEAHAVHHGLAVVGYQNYLNLSFIWCIIDGYCYYLHYQPSCKCY